jgi:hypothetical protein
MAIDCCGGLLTGLAVIVSVEIMCRLLAWVSGPAKPKRTKPKENDR